MKKYNNEPNMVGKAIKDARIKKEMTKCDVAIKLEQLGIFMSRNDIYRIENGKKILKDFELLAFCIVLDIDLNEVALGMLKSEGKCIEVGTIDTKLLRNMYPLKTDKLVITRERIKHINERHQDAYDMYEKYIVELIQNPDYILQDPKNPNTVFYLKKIKDFNLQLVVSLCIKNTLGKCNSVIMMLE